MNFICCNVKKKENKLFEKKIYKNECYMCIHLFDDYSLLKSPNIKLVRNFSSKKGFISNYKEVNFIFKSTKSY